MTDGIVTLDERHLAAAQEYRSILAEEKALSVRKEAAKAVLAEVLVQVGQTAVDADGVPLIALKPGSRRFNAEEAVRNLPAAALKMIVREVPDGKLAKEVLPPALYTLCTKETAPSISVL
jgi:hypothetical protein